MATLQEAHGELYAELQAAYRLDAEGEDVAALLEILVPLEDLVDHAQRIDLDTATEHYRADKAGPLVEAAIRLQRGALCVYAESILPADEAVVARELIFDLSSDLIDRARELRSRMWEVARGDE